MLGSHKLFTRDIFCWSLLLPAAFSLHSNLQKAIYLPFLDTDYGDIGRMKRNTVHVYEIRFNGIETEYEKLISTWVLHRFRSLKIEEEWGEKKGISPIEPYNYRSAA